MSSHPNQTRHLSRAIMRYVFCQVNLVLQRSNFLKTVIHLVCRAIKIEVNLIIIFLSIADRFDFLPKPFSDTDQITYGVQPRVCCPEVLPSKDSICFPTDPFCPIYQDQYPEEPYIPPVSFQNLKVLINH